MLKALDYAILRGVTASTRIQIPLEREPVYVCALLDEEAFNRDQHLTHRENVFIDDHVHDWNWRDGKFRYYARAGEVRDIVVVYAAEEVQSVMRFDPMTGKALVVQS